MIGRFNLATQQKSIFKGRMRGIDSPELAVVIKPGVAANLINCKRWLISNCRNSFRRYFPTNNEPSHIDRAQKQRYR